MDSSSTSTAPRGTVSLILEKIMNKECKKCGYYHGKFYDDVWLNCAIHPVGIKENCPDFEKASSKQDLNFVVMDEASIIISSTMVDYFQSRSNSLLINEASFTSFNFLNGYFINGETKNLVITMIEEICDYKLNLLQRRAFKNAMKEFRGQSDDKITSLKIIKKFSKISMLAELSTRMKYLL